MSFNTHLNLLQQSSNKYPNRPAFRVPTLVNGEVDDWEIVTYSQFFTDVETYAKQWRRVLAEDGLLPRTVVGLWYVLF